MTRLLVSVRDRAEACDALAGGADVIDVKEPTRGSLGAADFATIRDVLDEVAGARPTSAALGELLDADLDALGALPEALTMAKFGLAGCAKKRDWQSRWGAAIASLPSGVAPVAVVYADYEGAEAPRPDDVLSVAVGFGCSTVLVDTFDKSSGDLLSHWPLEALRSFVLAAHDAGLNVALAGSLTSPAISSILPLYPQIVAVRGAVCDTSRTSGLSLDKVREIAELIRVQPPTLNAGSNSAARQRECRSRSR
jgi:(5-formylfuran-3-yl)methyl phosphate synthase